MEVGISELQTKGTLSIERGCCIPWDLYTGNGFMASRLTREFRCGPSTTKIIMSIKENNTRTPKMASFHLPSASALLEPELVISYYPEHDKQSIVPVLALGSPHCW